MLLLPIGAGGVLYRPTFFADYVFDYELWNRTKFGNDDFLFRLGSLGKETAVVTACNEVISSLDGGTITCPTKILLRYPVTSYATAISAVSLFSESSRRVPRPYVHLGPVYDNPSMFSSLKLKADLRNLENKSITKKDNPVSYAQMKKAAGPNNDLANEFSWKRSVEYLVFSGQYHFGKDLQRFAPLERSQCRLLPVLPNGNDNSGSPKSIFHDWTGRVKSMIQSVYNDECGIQHCNGRGWMGCLHCGI